MPWQECNQMDERVKFIAGLLDGEKMAVLCRRFGISRKTGYKILNRYNSCGLEGLTDRSRRPYRHANQLPIHIEAQAWRRACRPYLDASLITGSPALLMMGLPASSRTGTGDVTPAAIWIGLKPRLTMFEWLSTFPLPVGNTNPRSPFGHLSFHSRNAFTTIGGMGIDL